MLLGPAGHVAHGTRRTVTVNTDDMKQVAHRLSVFAMYEHAAAPWGFSRRGFWMEKGARIIEELLMNETKAKPDGKGPSSTEVPEEGDTLEEQILAEERKAQETLWAWADSGVEEA